MLSRMVTLKDNQESDPTWRTSLEDAQVAVLQTRGVQYVHMTGPRAARTPYPCAELHTALKHDTVRPHDQAGNCFTIPSSQVPDFV